MKTPSGKPASFSKSPNKINREGSFSEGFKMKQLPQAIATTNIHIGTMAGKLNGVIPTQIPKGCRILQLSILLPTFSENSPLIKCGTPHINSTTSIPRVIEPIESLITFPCSSVTCAASLSISLTRSSLNLKNILDLVSGGVLDQELNAFFAEIIACSTSSLFAKLTSAIFSPKAGLYTSPDRLDWPKYSLPSIKWLIFFINF